MSDKRENRNRDERVDATGSRDEIETASSQTNAKDLDERDSDTMGRDES